MLPLPIAPALHAPVLGLALLYGVLTAVAFALWPLGRAHDVPASTLFRDEVGNDARWPRRHYVAATVLVVGTLATLAVALAHDHRTAVIFVAAAGAVLVTLRLIAGLLMRIARRLPHARSTVLRLAIANVYRPGALTTSVVLSLGLGLALLVTVIEIDGNLRRQFMAALPERAPAFFFSTSRRRMPAGSTRPSAAMRRARRSSACPCCAGASWRQTAFRSTAQTGGERDLGAAERSRHHLFERGAGGLARGGRGMVAAG